jgi:hypothetical protein
VNALMAFLEEHFVYWVVTNKDAHASAPNFTIAYARLTVQLLQRSSDVQGIPIERLVATYLLGGQTEAHVGATNLERARILVAELMDSDEPDLSNYVLGMDESDWLEVLIALAALFKRVADGERDTLTEPWLAHWALPLIVGVLKLQAKAMDRTLEEHVAMYWQDLT